MKRLAALFAAVLFAASASAQTILGYADDTPIPAADPQAVMYNAALNTAMLELHNACPITASPIDPCWTVPLADWRAEIIEAGSRYFGVMNTDEEVATARANMFLAQDPPLPRLIRGVPRKAQFP